MTEKNTGLPTVQNIKDYKLLRDMLRSQKNEFDLLSKKKANGQLNPIKIKIVNRVLEPLKELFKNEESHKFLDTLNDDDMPTNSDVVLIISQYETAIKDFRIKYYLRDEHKSSEYSTVTRWMTEEFPPDYYDNEENDEDYFDEDED